MWVDGWGGKSPSRQREQHGGSAGEASEQGKQWELRVERSGAGAQSQGEGMDFILRASGGFKQGLPFGKTSF